MADVWLARATGPGGFRKTVVLKTILPELASNPEFVRMFINEALLAAALDHPNIVHIFDLGEMPQGYFIAMEYIAGKTLRQIQKTLRKERKVPPVWFVLEVCSTVCDALAYAHTRCDSSGKSLDLVHRDVTPENIMVAFTGDTKVLDFGIAKASIDAAATKSGMLRGKYAYLAPEQIIGEAQGSTVDQRADIYSLGVVMYEMLTSVRPFRADNEVALLKAILETGRQPTPPTVLAPWVSKPLETIVLTAMARDPADRFQHAHEFRAAIEGYLSSQGLFPSGRHLAAQLAAMFPSQSSDGARITPQVTLPASAQTVIEARSLLSGGSVSGTWQGSSLSGTATVRASGMHQVTRKASPASAPPEQGSPRPTSLPADSDQPAVAVATGSPPGPSVGGDSLLRSRAGDALRAKGLPLQLPRPSAIAGKVAPRLRPVAALRGPPPTKGALEPLEFDWEEAPTLNLSGVGAVGAVGQEAGNREAPRESAPATTAGNGVVEGSWVATPDPEPARVVSAGGADVPVVDHPRAPEGGPAEVALAGPPSPAAPAVPAGRNDAGDRDPQVSQNHQEDADEALPHVWDRVTGYTERRALTVGRLSVQSGGGEGHQAPEGDTPRTASRGWDAALERIRREAEDSKRASVPREPGHAPSMGRSSQAILAFEAGLERLRAQDLDGALTAFERAVELDPDNRLLRSNLKLLKRQMEEQNLG